MNRSLVIVESPDFFVADMTRVAEAEQDRVYVLTKDDRTTGPNVIRADVRKDPAEAMAAVRRTVGVPGGVLTAQEMFLTETAALADALQVGHGSRETALRSRDKATMKRIWLDAGVSTPRGRSFRSAQDVRDTCADLSYPLIVKPSHGYASCGVRRVESERELREHLQAVSMINATVIGRERPDAGIVVEECLDGEEYSVDTVWFDGVPACDGLMSKGAAVGPYYPDRLYHIDPELPPAVAADIIRLSHDAVHALGIRSGATHTEIRLRGDVPYVLETTNRPGAGGLFYPLFQQAHGVDFARVLYHATLATSRGEFAAAGTPTTASAAAGTHYFWYNLPHPRPGVIREIRGLAELADRQEVLGCFCYKQPGGVLYPDGLNADYFCSVLGRYQPGPADPPISEFVRGYDEALEVVL
ncbi:acetyl-CoA carboxylase biotin carboxylase subunit family protein [Micromonospora sp. NPDC005203]|uniref:ATP-grasp domain-containing protein n=1 Tax=Micromonospora sp. NPDC005203 TaxID=3364226 RepID=UPI00368F56C8